MTDVKLNGMHINAKPFVSAYGATFYANFNVNIGPVYMQRCALLRRAKGRLDWQVPTAQRKNGGGEAGVVVKDAAVRAEVMRQAMVAFEVLGGEIPDEVWEAQEG